MLLERIKYNEHKWYMCCDLKVCGILLGQQGSYTKFPCFSCEWDSRAREKQWTVTRWPKSESLVPRTKNVIKPTLIDPQKVTPFTYKIRDNEAIYQSFGQEWSLLSIPHAGISIAVQGKSERVCF
jgi:hypothetical protein